MPFDFEKLVVFRGNDLLALMLNCLCHSALLFYGGETPSLRIAATVAVSRLCPFHCFIALFLPFWFFGLRLLGHRVLTFRGCESLDLLA